MKARARFGFMLVSLLAFLLAGCGKYEEQEREVGMKGAAKLNRLLAAERLAQEMGMEATSYAGAPSSLPPAGTTLMLPAESLRSEGVLSEMGGWVREGGHLIVYLTLEEKVLVYGGAGSAGDAGGGARFQAFLDYFGLDVQSVEEGEEEEETITSVRFGGDDYETDFETPYLISDKDDPDEELAAAVLSFDYGDGSLTVLGSAHLLSNEAIGKAAHATLWWDILGEGEGGQVWLIHSTRRSFFKLLWQQAPQAVMLLLVTVFLLVWWAARGFGPKFVRGANPSAKLDEHLQASGAFFVKHKAETLVIAQLQRRLFRRLARLLNQPLSLSDDELVARAQAQGILGDSQAAALVTAPTDKTWLASLQTLQILDKKL